MAVTDLNGIGLQDVFATIECRQHGVIDGKRPDS